MDSEKDNYEIQLSGCVIIKEEKILLLWKKKHNHYELPGGKVEDKESIEAAALRETKEETGCDVILKKYVGYKEFIIKEKNYRSHNFIAEIKEGQFPVVAEPEVFDHILWMPMYDYKKYSVAPNVKSLLDDFLSGKINY